MIIVTGGAGFIGSNIVKHLNSIGYDQILVVDDLADGRKFKNLSECKLLDYIDKVDFLNEIAADKKFIFRIAAIFHQGACSSTTEWDGRYMLKNNFEYSKQLLHYSLKQNIPFIYASSAAVYGASKNFQELPEYEKPLNVYGYSKLLFDQYVRHVLPIAKNQIVGLRYFNVYGPNEEHKGGQASVILHFREQAAKAGRIKLFKGSDGYADGEQRRDFVYVDDIAAVNLWFWQNQGKSGIYNVGTGNSRSFNEVAKEVIAFYKHGVVEYIPFPQNLGSYYQSFTKADISSLRAAGYERQFKTLEDGIKEYLNFYERR